MQVDILRNEIESQSRKRDALESRASEAEKKVQELNLKLESVSIYIFLIELLHLMNNIICFYLACRVYAVSGS